jgi:hypothetical protein
VDEVGGTGNEASGAIQLHTDHAMYRHAIVTANWPGTARYMRVLVSEKKAEMVGYRKQHVVCNPQPHADVLSISANLI